MIEVGKEKERSVKISFFSFPSETDHSVTGIHITTARNALVSFGSLHPPI
jgi:hypothetical protein